VREGTRGGRGGRGGGGGSSSSSSYYYHTLLLPPILLLLEREPKVTQHDVGAAVQKHIVWLDVPVDNVLTVDILQCLGHLVTVIRCTTFFVA
jgi:hypothetical protein